MFGAFHFTLEYHLLVLLNISLSGYTMPCESVNQLVDVWVVSTLQLLQNIPLDISELVVCELVSPILLNVYLGVKLWVTG